ncbi:carbohydrate kinase [Niallia sp.]|uniref:carbohydrate kinase family protein n=1 Tax=Niallia sp. TaxID=2837523 RepID=UPI002897FE11|nr:carbohydrate kinase [Niallia sp.]
MIDVVALGEILMDFTPQGTNELGFPILVANPGGAPGNVLVALSCLGMQTEFIGCRGSDYFGELLVSTLQDKGVQTNGITYSDVKTTLAFVHIDQQGDRSFDFYRQPGADMMLSKNDIDFSLISNARILHVGSISMTSEPSREATLIALNYAKEHNKIISFDPNLRPLLWESLVEAKKHIETVMQFADIVKVSEEELEFITGIREISLGAKQLYKMYNLQLLFVTMGEKGSYAYGKDGLVFVPGIAVKAIDTTGCGDAFIAGALYELLKRKLLNLEIKEETLKQILTFGNAMGAYVAKNKGGIPSMPTLSQIEEFILANQKSGSKITGVKRRERRAKQVDI